jgi:hypothetical protein
MFVGAIPLTLVGARTLTLAGAKTLTKLVRLIAPTTVRRSHRQA